MRGFLKVCNFDVSRDYNDQHEFGHEASPIVFERVNIISPGFLVEILGNLQQRGGFALSTRI